MADQSEKKSPQRHEPRVRLPAQQSLFGPTVRILGRHHAPVDDIYHFIMTRPWWQFLLLAAGLFLLINALFAGLYLLQPGAIANARPGFFEDAFSFSVQTLATIGYGGMMPATRFGHALVTLQAILGMLLTALVTGVTFSRFARPTAKVLFSQRAVITTRDGVPHLMFRMANWRHNTIVEARLRVILLVRERTREGEEMRRPVEVPLVRDSSAMFVMTWTAMHRIDAASPFYGCAAAIERLRQQDAQVFLSFSGTDETFAQTIHARYSYRLDDIVIGARFHDVLTIEPDGRRVIDYSHFHDVVPVPLLTEVAAGEAQTEPSVEPTAGAA